MYHAIQLKTDLEGFGFIDLSTAPEGPSDFSYSDFSIIRWTQEMTFRSRTVEFKRIG